ncbi:hypothetical protein ACNO8S_19855 (plasmid) [Haloarcula sp. KBTZ06]|uniref:hypothetical protein n=1 Tax=unclassified Haloarcula TaxID=2624677 RepID=UPI00300EBE14
MPNPYADDSIVMEGTTSDATEYLQFQPNNLPGDCWLHRRDQFDSTVSEPDIRDEYALPTDSAITVRVIEVPADVDIRIGTLGPVSQRSGGADLVELRNYQTVPGEWEQNSTSLETFLSSS